MSEAVDEPVVVLCAAIHKDRALLCLDCDHIFAMAGEQRCPVCGGKVAVRVARALDQEVTAK